MLIETGRCIGHAVLVILVRQRQGIGIRLIDARFVARQVGGVETSVQ